MFEFAWLTFSRIRKLSQKVRHEHGIVVSTRRVACGMWRVGRWALGARAPRDTSSACNFFGVDDSECGSMMVL